MNSTSTASSRQPHFAANLCEGLERLGEFRREWLKNPKYVRATVWGLALLFGFLGVLFGYVLYFQLEPVVHDANLLDARSLVFGVFTAAVLGALSEWIRQVIDDGAERLFPPRRIVIITALTLLLFELFIASAHKIAENLLESAEEASGFHRALGDIFTGSAGEFLILALFWMIPGVVLASVLSQTIFWSGWSSGAQSRAGVLFAVAAVILSAVLIMLCIIILNGSLVAYNLVFDHSNWRGLLSRQSALGWSSARLFQSKYAFAHSYLVLVPVAAAFLWAVLRIKTWSSKDWKAMAWLLAAAAGFLGLAVTEWTLVRVPIYVCIVWSVPAVILGAMAPRLRSSSQLHPRLSKILLVFVPLAPVSYIVLCLLRLLEFHGIIMVVALIPAAILIGARSEIRNKSELKEYWPLAALATGICSIVLVALLLYPLGSLSFFNDMPGLTSQGNFSKTLFGDGLPQSKNVRPLQNSGTTEGAKKQNQKEEDLAEKHKDLRLSQLCIVGSTCFWATALIVLMWSIRLTHERVEHVGTEGPEKNRQDIGINLSMK